MGNPQGGATTKTSSPPMTKEEQDFAVENHDLVIRFLAMNRLPADEWYDVVIFRYLRSVVRWHEELELHYYSFSTLAFSAMRSTVGGERAKQARRIQTISIDDVIPGTDGVTYADTVTYENLNYIQYA